MVSLTTALSPSASETNMKSGTVATRSRGGAPDADRNFKNSERIAPIPRSKSSRFLFFRKISQASFVPS
jgi:hypothetical protein